MVFGFLRRRKDERPVQPIIERIDPRVRLQEISIKLKILIEKLERSEAALEEKNKQLFEKVVRAESMKEKERAALYANEIVQVRKIAKTIWIAITALEKVALRLETVKSAIEAKEILTSPELGVLRPLSESLRGVMPEVSLELTKINENLEEVTMSFGTIEPYSTYFSEEHDEEVQAILRQASEIAVQRMKTSFPDLPGMEREGEKEQSKW